MTRVVRDSERVDQLKREINGLRGRRAMAIVAAAVNAAGTVMSGGVAIATYVRTGEPNFFVAAGSLVFSGGSGASLAAAKNYSE